MAQSQHLLQGAPVTCSNRDIEVKVTGPNTEKEDLETWDWASASEIQTPDVDDRHLRREAECVQRLIGVFRSAENGAVVHGLDEPLETFDIREKLTATTLKNDVLTQTEVTLLERVGILGDVALDVLRYFSDNPGDKSAHAEQVLGYLVSDINKLLAGSLSKYLKRCESGGWKCHPWVPDLLTALDNTL